MSRKHFYWDGSDWVEYVPKRGQKRGPILLSDTSGYRNVIDGAWVDGRAAHREFLKRNHVHEVGNAPIQAAKPQASYAETKELREDIGKAYNMLAEGYTPEPVMTQSEFEAIGE